MLNIYNWADYVGANTIAEFERRTHIKVVYEFYDSNQTLEAKLLAGRSGYDIVSTTTAFFGRQIQAGAYLALDKAQLTNWKNLDPAVLAVQAPADPSNRYATNPDAIVTGSTTTRVTFVVLFLGGATLLRSDKG